MDSPRTASLTALPYEVLAQIVDFLSIEPTYRPLEDIPLKALASTCKGFRRILFTELFRYLRLRIGQAPELIASALQQWRIESVLVVRFTRAVALTKEVIHACRVLGVSRVMLIAKPSALGEYFSRIVDSTHAWAFDMDHQIFQYDTFRGSARYDLGSFLPAYHTYEYHQLCAPHIFHDPTRIAPLPVLNPFFTALRHFTLVAVFPFNVMPRICDRLQDLSLQSLEVQLAARSSNRDLSTIRSASATDFWQELEDNYRVLRSLVETHKYLVKYAILDYPDKGCGPIVDRVMREIQDWKDVDPGQWRRDLAFERMDA